MKHNSCKLIITVFGTRPEVIKLAPLIEELSNHSDFFRTRIVATAQHRKMMDQVLKVFQIKPHYDLNIMTRNQSLYQSTSEILNGLKPIFAKSRPNLVIVQGDTTTTFASALAAFYARIPVAHIEAGLRTGNPYYPFPEEMNRRLTAVLSSFHFAPTEFAASNLKKEGVPEQNIFITGNTVVDALQKILKRNTPDTSLPFSLDGHKIVLVTAHRRESFNRGLKLICQSIKKLIELDKEIQVIYPVHMNPNVRKVVLDELKHHERIHLCRPRDYPSFVSLMAKARLILTDSGGIQEEAPSLGVPVVVLRNETERVEAIDSGIVVVAGLNPERIVRESLRFLNLSSSQWKNMKNPYGDGKASERIVKILIQLSQKGYF